MKSCLLQQHGWNERDSQLSEISHKVKIRELSKPNKNKALDSDQETGGQNGKGDKAKQGGIQHDGGAMDF